MRKLLSRDNVSCQVTRILDTVKRLHLLDQRIDVHGVNLVILASPCKWQLYWQYEKACLEAVPLPYRAGEQGTYLNLSALELAVASASFPGEKESSCIRCFCTKNLRKGL